MNAWINKYVIDEKPVSHLYVHINICRSQSPTINRSSSPQATEIATNPQIEKVLSTSEQGGQNDPSQNNKELSEVDTTSKN